MVTLFQSDTVHSYGQSKEVTSPVGVDLYKKNNGPFLALDLSVVHSMF